MLQHYFFKLGGLTTTTISGNEDSFDDCHVGLLYQKPHKTMNKDKWCGERIYKTVDKDKGNEERFYKTANEDRILESKKEERIHKRGNEDGGNEERICNTMRKEEGIEWSDLVRKMATKNSQNICNKENNNRRIC